MGQYRSIIKGDRQQPSIDGTPAIPMLVVGATAGVGLILLISWLCGAL